MSEPTAGTEAYDRQTIQYIDADNGQPFDIQTFLEEVDVGTTATKRIYAKNTGIYPIKLTNPSAKGLRVVSYPEDWIPRGASKVIELAFDVPKQAIVPPTGSLDFRLVVSAVE